MLDYFQSLRVKISDTLLELFLGFPSQVSDQPLGGEGILWRHPITHHSVQEGLPLPRVETQHLEDGMGQKASGSVSRRGV